MLSLGLQILPLREQTLRVNLTNGREIKKTRPALVIQNDIANRHSPITIVAAITSRFDQELYPTEALVKTPEGGLNVDSVVLLNQTISIIWTIAFPL